MSSRVARPQTGAIPPRDYVVESQSCSGASDHGSTGALLPGDWMLSGVWETLDRGIAGPTGQRSREGTT